VRRPELEERIFIYRTGEGVPLAEVGVFVRSVAPDPVVGCGHRTERARGWLVSLLCALCWRFQQLVNLTNLSTSKLVEGVAVCHWALVPFAPLAER
jgi:hypothetical protein